MLDEEKIKLMTKVTIYEKHQEMGDMILSRYYREDYVQYGCLKTLVGALFRLLFFWRYFSWKWSPPRPSYPFLSELDRSAAREQFLLHRADYVPKFIPQSVYDIYIAPYTEQASS